MAMPRPIGRLSKRWHDAATRSRFSSAMCPGIASIATLPAVRYCRSNFIESLPDIPRFAPVVRDADLVILGSYVPDGIAIWRMDHDPTPGVSPPSTISTRP